MKKKSGTQLIAEERQRQIKKEGWTKEHDKVEHHTAALTLAAACYALNKIPKMGKYSVCSRSDKSIIFDAFPFAPEHDKREKHSRLKSLIVAGALIAAEIDRIKED